MKTWMIGMKTCLNQCFRPEWMCHRISSLPTSCATSLLKSSFLIGEVKPEQKGSFCSGETAAIEERGVRRAEGKSNRGTPRKRGYKVLLGRRPVRERGISWPPRFSYAVASPREVAKFSEMPNRLIVTWFVVGARALRVKRSCQSSR